MEPAAFRFVAQCLNHYATACLPMLLYCNPGLCKATLKTTEVSEPRLVLPFQLIVKTARHAAFSTRETGLPTHAELATRRSMDHLHGNLRPVTLSFYLIINEITMQPSQRAKRNVCKIPILQIWTPLALALSLSLSLSLSPSRRLTDMNSWSVG
jgi:hypothetical protein